MNKTTTSNPVRLIAFFLTAIILTCTFGFTVDGWADLSDDPNDEGKDKPSNSEDSNQFPSLPEDDQTSTEPEIHIPEYTHRLTGLEITKGETGLINIAVVMDSTLPLYGISSADILCKIPTEEGSKYLAFLSDTSKLWKIGSLSPTRGYISNLASYFSGAMLCYGTEDKIDYTQCDIGKTVIDLTKNQGYHYTESTGGIFTNHDLLSGALADSDLSFGSCAPLPFVHNEFGQEEIVFYDNIATNVIIDRSGKYDCELRYDTESGSYTVYKNGDAITDAATNDVPTFENCFILFADSITYDRTDINQMVLDTVGSGSGYYITNGSYTEIKWSAASGGIMTFYSQSGEKLTINRGKIFLSFVKSSLSNNISFQ